jgi:hypothetical protein
VKFDGKEFKGEFPGAVPHAMHILSGGQHLKALNRQTLPGLDVPTPLAGFFGQQQEPQVDAGKRTNPGPPDAFRGGTHPRRGPGTRQASAQAEDGQKARGLGSFEGTKEDVTEYCDSTPSQDAYLSWLELRARDFVYGCQVKTDDNDDD